VLVGALITIVHLLTLRPVPIGHEGPEGTRLA
jgi:hypothetical protein